MNKLYLTLTAVGLCLSGIAQTYTVTPSDTVEGDAPDEQYTEFAIMFNNTANDKIELAYDLLTNTFPPEWDFSLCDNVNCFIAAPTNATMDSIDVSGTAAMLLNLKPNGVDSTGILSFYVYDTQFPNSGDTVAFIITSTAVGVAEVEALSPFSVYPNPTAENLFITNQSSDKGMVNIYNIAGAKVYAENVLPNTNLQLDVSSYSKGTYILEYTVNGKVYTHKVMKQ